MSLRPHRTVLHGLIACSALVLAACGAGGSSPAAATGPAAAPSGTPRALALNDVSVLFPLGQGELWAATTPGRNGEPLLRREDFDLIRRDLVRELSGGEVYGRLRVVSLRVDPCFAGALPCRPQIRLVFQALTPDGARAFDGAVHALYNLEPGAWATFRAGLIELTASAPENASVPRLEVSPALRSQGMSGAYARGLQALVLPSIGGGTLSKMTFMTRDNGTRWDFGGFNLRGFEPLGAFPIPGVAAPTQTVRQNGGGPGQGPGPGAPGPGFNYTVTPSVAEGATLAVALASGAASAASADARQRAMDALARIENPHLESAESVDCAACHLANRTRGNLQTVYGLASSLAFASSAEALRQMGNAENDPNNLRAFGYVDTQPAIAQRTANETVLVLAQMR